MTSPFRRRTRLRIALALGLALAFRPGVGVADDAAAAQNFQAGTTAFERGEYVTAARAFEAANRDAPRGATLYNAGRAWEAAKEPARAADAYDAALRLGGLAGPQAAGAGARLTALRSSLGRVEIIASKDARVSVAHVEEAIAPVTVHVAPGRHDVRARFGDGRTASRSVVVEAGGIASLTVDAPATPSTGLAPRATASTAPTPKAPAPARGESPSANRVLGWTALGGAILVTGAAVGLGVLTIDARDTFDAGGRRDRSEHDDAVGLRTWTNVAWIGAGVLAVTGLVLLVTAPSPPAHGEGARVHRVRAAPGRTYGASAAGDFRN